MNDFARTVLGDFDSRAFSPFLVARRSDKPFLLSVLDFRPPTLGRRLTFSAALVSGGTKVPGPTDFRGALGPAGVFEFGLLNAFGGNWLCRRPRPPIGPWFDGICIDSDRVDTREVVDAVEVLRLIGVVYDCCTEFFLLGTGIAALWEGCLDIV